MDMHAAALDLDRLRRRLPEDLEASQLERIASIESAHAAALVQLEERRAARAAARAASAQRIADLEVLLEQERERALEQDRLAALEEARATRDVGFALEGLLEVLEEVTAPPVCEVQRPQVLRQGAGAPAGRCVGAAVAGELCRRGARDPFCAEDPERAAERRLALRLMRGGRVEARPPTPKERRDMLARDMDRSLGILFRAAKRWRLASGERHDAAVPAGADLTRVLDGGRAFRRHWQPLLSAGLVEHVKRGGEAVVAGKTPVRLTAKGAEMLGAMAQERMAA